MNRNLFIKYIQNRCSDDELNQIRHWFETEASRISGRVFLSKFWKEMQDDRPELNLQEMNLLSRIHHDLNTREANRLMEKTQNDPVKFKKRRTIINSIARIAAVLLLPVIILTTYLITVNQTGKIPANYNPYTTVYSPVGSVSQVDLPDGTRVWLNHNSTLVYPDRFRKNTRNVKLSGEAYFEVTHNPSCPFTVSVGEIDIVAKGTIFNICAFPETKKIETTLVEGIVEICKRDENGKIRRVFSMQPNELAVYNTEYNKLVYSSTLVDKHILWKEGKLMFQNDPLDMVAERLSRFYNVEIIIEDPVLSQYTYTATFMNETLYQVLELLKLATPIDFRIGDRMRKEDGSWTKRKVSIFYKKH